LKIICCSPPAVGRDPFHQPRVPEALSSLALDTAREGAAGHRCLVTGPGPALVGGFVGLKTQTRQLLIKSVFGLHI